MKAIITKQVSNAHNYGGEKETVNTMKAAVTHKGAVIVPVEIRFYMGRSRSASTVYASIWVHDAKSNIYTSGKGSAGGWGYHKESAAAAEAISSAGIELWGSPYAGREGDMKKRAHIGGCGEQSVEEALRAIVKALGYRGKVTIL